jgi:hypothetical protein
VFLFFRTGGSADGFAVVSIILGARF